MKSIRQGQGRKHLGQNDKKLCPSCLTKIVPTRFYYACVILLVGYQYNRSSMALSSIMSNYKEAAAEERVGSKEGEEPSASGGKRWAVMMIGSAGLTLLLAHRS
jgi:hypothetical protein